MKILVTGGAGYIGSHTCKALAEAGHEPVAYDNLTGGHRAAVRWGPLEVGDIADAARLEDVIDRHRPGAVMHFAGLISVGDSVKNPDLFHRVNVEGSRVLVESVRGHGIRHFVFSSSCATYGTPRVVPIPEDHPQVPTNPYGLTKLAVERMLVDVPGNALNCALLRYFNAAGADPAGEIGEDHQPETHLLPNALLTALGHRRELEIFGTDYPTLDGTAVRDYVHVSDLAAAHVLALDHLARSGGRVAFNVGTGRGYTVREVIDMVERVTQTPLTVRERPRRSGDEPVLVAAADRAKEVLGWNPVRSTLESIVRDAWRWHRAAHPLRVAGRNSGP